MSLYSLMNQRISYEGYNNSQMSSFVKNYSLGHIVLVFRIGGLMNFTEKCNATWFTSFHTLTPLRQC